MINFIIIIAQKPIKENYACNCSNYGCGGINIDGCRVGTEKRKPASLPKKQVNPTSWSKSIPITTDSGQNPQIGRWTANLYIEKTENIIKIFPMSLPGGGFEATHSSVLFKSFKK